MEKNNKIISLREYNELSFKIVEEAGKEVSYSKSIKKMLKLADLKRERDKYLETSIGT